MLGNTQRERLSVKLDADLGTAPWKVYLSARRRVDWPIDKWCHVLMAASSSNADDGTVRTDHGGKARSRSFLHALGLHGS